MKKLQGNFIRKLNRAEKEPSFPDRGERTLSRISSSTSGTGGRACEFCLSLANCYAEPILPVSLANVISSMTLRIPRPATIL